MRSIVPTQNPELANKEFPITGYQRERICSILTMEMFGCSLASVAKEMGTTADEIISITESPDYAYIKQSMIAYMRKMDAVTLAGRVNQEATEAFERMSDLASSAKREDVRFNANKDILDRAMLNNVAANGQADELRITFVKRR